MRKGEGKHRPGVKSLVAEVLKSYLRDGDPDDIEYEMLELYCALHNLTVEQMIEFQDYLWGNEDVQSNRGGRDGSPDQGPDSAADGDDAGDSIVKRARALFAIREHSLS
jgi:hypothetical protein